MIIHYTPSDLPRTGWPLIDPAGIAPEASITMEAEFEELMSEIGEYSDMQDLFYDADEPDNQLLLTRNITASNQHDNTSK